MKFHQTGGNQHKWLNNWNTPHKTEIDTCDYLLMNGIPAVNGKATHYKYVDLVAFGCVCIEVKYSELTTKNHYQWRAKPRWHNHGIRADVVILAVKRGDYIERTIWDVNEPIFYLPNGQLKQGLSYNPYKRAHASRDYGVSIDKRSWNHHIDRFDIIHDKLRHICMNDLTPEHYHRYKLDWTNGNPAQEAEPVYTPIVQEQRQLSLL